MSDTSNSDLVSGIEFFTMDQLAERWQRDKRSIMRDIASGKLVVHHFGRSVRIAKDDILLYETVRRRKRR